MPNCDFSGWATKNDLRCADGKIIRSGAFKIQNGHKVPLVWNHKHDSPNDILGHAVLENRNEGVYAYCYFNQSPSAKAAKESVAHGDITALSIWANNLDLRGSEVLHGAIREVSLVPAGANPGAFIESVMIHGVGIEEDDTEAYIFTGEVLHIAHAAPETKTVEDTKSNEEPTKDDSQETVADIYRTLNEKQKKAVAIIVGQAITDAKSENEDEDEEDEESDMKHNIFDQGSDKNTAYLSHDDMKQIFIDAKRCGSLREAVQQRVDDGELVHSAISKEEGMTTATGTQTYGFNDPSMLFPEYKTLVTQPEWISRNMDWVSKVMNNVHKTPFSRIKSVYADITEDEARAKGYIKGKQKKEEVFSTLKRTTDPQTIYKKQKMDRDDIIDITDFDVVAWIRAEMRIMLNEEIARAILIGDGRSADAEDKIQEIHVRPIATDVDLFNVKTVVTVQTDASAGDVAETVIDEILRARKKYKGSGNPLFFTTEDTLTEMLLLKDKVGHRLYKTEAELATALRVSEIVTVEPMEGQKISINNEELDLIGIVVNLKDYNVGADKGGEINLFDDFDIDYNQYKYLIETRISGALIKPFSALTFGLRKGTAIRNARLAKDMTD